MYKRTCTTIYNNNKTPTVLLNIIILYIIDVQTTRTNNTYKQHVQTTRTNNTYKQHVQTTRTNKQVTLR
jgi:hypothetical protein